jgi:uncharacterized membrane protein
LFLIVTPPFQAPDEYQHFFRTYQLSKGQIIAEQRGGETGGEVAASLHHVVVGLLGSVPFNPDNKVPVDDIRAMLTHPLEPDQEHFVDFRTIALYTPVAHLPQTVGITIGRVLRLPTLLMFYLGRTFAMVTAVALTALAIRVTPIFKWWLFVFAFLPMTTFLRSSLSADTTTISLALLLLALCLRYAFADKPRVDRRGTFALIAAAVGLALAKQSYFLLPLLFLLIPTHHFGSWRRYAFFCVLLFGGGLLLISLWTVVARGIFYADIRDCSRSCCGIRRRLRSTSSDARHPGESADPAERDRSPVAPKYASLRRAVRWLAGLA